MSIKFLMVLTAILMVSCNKQERLDIEKEKDEILKLHRLQREYHFNKDSIAFANQLSEHFISINRGAITQPKQQETISKYHNYFSSVEFVKWDDVTEPIIRFSEDGKLAYTIVDKIVKVNYESDNGEIIDGETHFAWTAIYKKYGNEWKIDCITSTEKPVHQ